MKTITILDFAQKAVSLKSSEDLCFRVTYENGDKMNYFITLITHAESNCLYGNCHGGGDSFVFDITTYCSDLKALSQSLDEYVNGRSGVYGYVELMDSPATDEAAYILEFEYLPAFGFKVYNGQREHIADILDIGKVKYYDISISKAAKEEINAVARVQADKREADFLNSNGNVYGIYLYDQDSDSARISKGNYYLAWFGSLEDGDTLDRIRERFSEEQPYNDYLPRKNGPNFGPGDIIVLKQDGEVTAWYVDQLAYSRLEDFFGTPKYILISVCEREITTTEHPTFEEAYALMEKELDETMSTGRETYTEGDEYELGDDCAWSNTNRDAKSDWQIVKIS